MKTTKYYISFENLDYAMSDEIEISKAEYLRQLSLLRKQVENTKNDETPITERNVQIYDKEVFVKTIISFNHICAYTDLIKVECKEGYRFKTKKEERK